MKRHKGRLGILLLSVLDGGWTTAVSYESERGRGGGGEGKERKERR
jgi:hypothetical protein